MRCHLIVLLLVLVGLIAACGHGSNTSSSSATNVIASNTTGTNSLPAKLEDLEKLPGGRNVSLMSTDLNDKFEVLNNLGTPAAFPLAFNKKGLNYAIYRLSGITNQQQPTSFKATFTGSQSKLWFAVFNKDQGIWNWYYKSGNNTVPFQLTSNKALSFPTSLQPSFRTDQILADDKVTVKIAEGRMYIAVVADLADGESLNISKLYVSLSNQSTFGANVTIDPDPAVIDQPVTFTVVGTGGIASKYDVTYEFGDGSAPLVKKGLLGGDTTKFTYKEEKSFPVKVTVTDSVDPSVTPYEFAKDLTVSKGKNITWTSTGGTVNGNNLTATFDTAGLAVGKYKITATMTGGNIQFDSQSKYCYCTNDTKGVVNLSVTEGGTSNKVDFWVYITDFGHTGKIAPDSPGNFPTYRFSGGKNLKYYLDQKNAMIINFWGTWCPPCKNELPHMTATAVEYKDKKYMHIGVSDGSYDADKAWLDSNGTPYKYGPSWTDDFMDGAGKIRGAYVATKANPADDGGFVPCTYLVSPDNYIVEVYPGGIALNVWTGTVVAKIKQMTTD